MSGNLNLDTTVFYNELQSRLDGVSSETPSTDLVKLFRTSELYDAADYTIFAAEVQSRINAVDEFTSDTELLKLAASLAKIANKNQEGISNLESKVESVGSQYISGLIPAGSTYSITTSSVAGVVFDSLFKGAFFIQGGAGVYIKLTVDEINIFSGEAREFNYVFEDKLTYTRESIKLEITSTDGSSVGLGTIGA